MRQTKYEATYQPCSSPGPARPTTCLETRNVPRKIILRPLRIQSMCDTHEILQAPIETQLPFRDPFDLPVDCLLDSPLSFSSNESIARGYNCILRAGGPHGSPPVRSDMTNFCLPYTTFQEGIFLCREGYLLFRVILSRTPNSFMTMGLILIPKCHLVFLLH